MSHVPPAQRTANTAKLIIGAGVLTSATAILHGSIVATIVAGLLVFCGGGLFVAARQAA